MHPAFQADFKAYVQHLRWLASSQRNLGWMAEFVNVREAELLHAASSSAMPLCHAQPPLLTGSPLAEVVLSHASMRPWRYYTLLPCTSAERGTDTEVCLLFKNKPNAEEWVGALRSADGGASFRGAPSLVLPPGPTVRPMMIMVHASGSGSGLSS